MNKELRKLLDAIEAAGFTAKRTSDGHYVVRSGEGGYVTTLAGTPSDWRSNRNALAALRRAGVRIRRKGE